MVNKVDKLRAIIKHCDKAEMSAIVAKANSLLPAMSKFKLSELRLLSYCLSFIDPRPDHREVDVPGYSNPVDQSNITFVASVKDLLRIFPNMGEKTAYDVIKQAVKGINARPYENDAFVMEDGRVAMVTMYWFMAFYYYPKEGKFEFKLNPEVVDLVLSLKANFTKFKLENVYQFKSGLSWKLYEQLKQWVTVGRWSVSLEEFRTRMNIIGKYQRWDFLRARVILKAVNEINTYSDLHVSFTPQTRMRSVIGVTFFIQTKEEEEKLEQARNDPSIIANIGDTRHDVEILMKDGGLTEAQSVKISAFAKEVGFDVEHKLIQVLASYKKASSAEKFKHGGTKAAYVCACFKQALGPTLFDRLISQPSTETHEEAITPRPRAELQKAIADKTSSPETPEKTLQKLSNAEQLELAKCRTRNQVSRNNGICGEGDEGKEQCQKCMLYYNSKIQPRSSAQRA